MFFDFRRLLPASQAFSLRERIRAPLGALLGIAVTAAFGALAVQQGQISPAIIAPMGASAVLLFAAPASPLAQPWSVLGGNGIAAAVGVAVTWLVPDQSLAAALAVSLAIAAMIACRCLHPPGGAVALTAVVGGPAVHDLGLSFVLWPVLGNSLLLLVSAMLYHRLTRGSYPHRQQPAVNRHATSDPAPLARIGFEPADLDEVLKDFDQYLDIDRDDLETILRRTELRSYRRRALHVTCESIMSRDVVAVGPDTSLREAHELMRRHHFRALPVTNEKAEVVGIVTQSDFLHKPRWVAGQPRIDIAQRLRLILSGATAPNDTVKDIMTAPVRTLRPETPLADAVILFAEGGLHDLPVVRESGKLAGILSQSDALVAMLQDRSAGAAPIPSPAA
ncbi:HPP family protein [Rhizobium sp. SSA_523]|uniref:HPP family protein n=1 Tax=Rhizobium sp. SSA_523 TaxID=2952477 RepID=UPI00209186C9|nr:HPP family protein [Rhizobium sp. SSA_523]MCO5733757.1 HPP family protein [Rhizobium sp. SSA_523]WKC24969.1 HPP family protein [Rhizobium sp. SSA_523]